MGTVRFTLTDDYQPSEESLKRLAALEDRPIDYSDDPHQTMEELEEMRLLAIEKRKKKRMFSLRLQSSTITWWKSLGNGYTSIMARLLDEAKNHPEWVKMCL
jgi:uncharacterized protein (DUF4415 family)